MASSEIHEQNRHATIDRSLGAAIEILEKPGVKEILDKNGYADIYQLLQYLYVPNLAVGNQVSKLTTPNEYKDDTSVAVTASFREETIRLDQASTSLHEQQAMASTHFAASNGLRDGLFLDQAKRAITESFNDNRNVQPIKPRTERAVSMEGSVDIASHDYRLWGKPVLILASGLYERERQEGLALVELLLHTHHILSREPTIATAVNAEDIDVQEKIDDIILQIATASLPRQVEGSKVHPFWPT